MDKELFSELGRFLLTNLKNKWGEWRNSFLTGRRIVVFVLLSSVTLTGGVYALLHVLKQKYQKQKLLKRNSVSVEVQKFAFLKFFCCFF